MKDKSKKNSYSYSQPTFIQPYFDNFIHELSKGGYSQLTTQAIIVPYHILQLGYKIKKFY